MNPTTSDEVVSYTMDDDEDEEEEDEDGYIMGG